ncbi:interleukin-1 receptor type 2-like [Stegastes partitus]|uniref:Interleukin-1 receptor type 2-like n=1 Tax=Stegastes partitus TaxID=144197 RepID=A0A3B5APL4_9TELE|nr:PREDICTED: interleukin-1 receptor type 2-like [Stegastes partitus]
MVYWALMLVVVIMECVCGKPPLPPLPMKDGCYVISPEVEIFRVEGEAVILYFPMFMRVLKVRNIAPPTAKYFISKDNGTAGVEYQGEGRVQQHDKQLWFLPAQASDSGEYTCTYRNETYCVTGSITLQVYESTSVDMKKLSYPLLATVGEKQRFECPSLSYFNSTDSLIEWYKDSSTTALQPGRAGSSHWDEGKLVIPAVRRSHAGVYTCQLRVLINNQPYKVSRAFQLNVQGQDPEITTTTSVPDLSETSDTTFLSSTYSTAHTPLVLPPVIVSPLNGTTFESSHGSGLELFCTVLTECPMAESTVVTWLVNDQSVETSYLDRRALQGGRRVTRVYGGCQIEMRLFITMITEEDVETQLKCVTQNTGGRQEAVVQLQLEDSTFTWLVVAAVAVSCFLAVVSIFLYVLFKPKKNKKMDYILARQNSTFSC